MRRVLLAFVLVSHFAQAEVATISGSVKLVGNGCPKSATDISVADDGTSLSVLFRNYNLEIGGATNKLVAAKSCTLTIPLSVPSGYRLRVNTVDYRGFVESPANVRADINSWFFLQDSRSVSTGRLEQILFRRPVSEDLFLQPDQPVTGKACGGRATLYVLSTASLMATRKVATSLLQLDSLDFGTDSSFSEHIDLIPCR